MTTGVGILPLRNPGILRSLPSALAACSRERSTSLGATSASTRTRDSGSSVTVVCIASDDSVGSVRPRPRLAAWLYTGPLGHLYAGLADTASLLARYGWARLRGRPVG